MSSMEPQKKGGLTLERLAEPFVLITDAHIFLGCSALTRITELFGLDSHPAAFSIAEATISDPQQRVRALFSIASHSTDEALLGKMESEIREKITSPYAKARLLGKLGERLNDDRLKEEAVTSAQQLENPVGKSVVLLDLALTLKRKDLFGQAHQAADQIPDAKEREHIKHWITKSEHPEDVPLWEKIWDLI